MSICNNPTKSLFDTIEFEMTTFLQKYKVIHRKNVDNNFSGGAFMFIPMVIGVVINLLTVNNNHYTTSNRFQGVSIQMQTYKNNQHSLPKELDYDVDDYRRREQLFNLLTKGEYDDKQLQLYRTFDQPRKDQIDIQKCLYVLTRTYFEYKYKKEKFNDNIIKGIIFFIFSNHLYLVALIGYFVQNDESKLIDAQNITSEISGYVIPIESVYKQNGTFLYDNDLEKRNKLMRMKTRSQTRKNNDLGIEQFYDPNIEGFSVENIFARNDKLKRQVIIPMRTRSQTRKKERVVPVDFIPHSTSGWKEKSHMLWKKNDTSGGTSKKTLKRNHSNRSRQKK